MNPLSALFGMAVAARGAMYDRGLLKSRGLRGPVISVGNISAGGSGKTPFVIALGELLKERGIAFDILSRGYRRESKGIAVVESNGCAREFGDEPLLIARRLGVPVVVGSDRYLAGQFAEERFGPQLHILDDGFQHRRLARDFDIVLVTPTDATDTLLPIGRLREPLSALARAHAVVVTPGANAVEFPVAGKHVWHIERGIDLARVPDKPLAFCGIARPKNFFDQLHACGVRPRAELAFRDHHRYTAADVEKILDVARIRGCETFITTEKDEVNLGPLAEGLQPLHVVRATATIREQDDMLKTLLTVARSRTVV